ncbi:MAG: FHA domain-containing protein, partial [Deltaproteobacteria bacterium]|nr:FHA domain-containing protein [Deltaproteobacteria bacterium]
MVELMFIEFLDRAGRVTQRLRLDTLPLQIGRAYTNDVILDDRYISPEHLRIERDADGNFVATDLATLNGTFRLPSGRRIERIRIGDDMRLRIGETELRFRAAAHAVEAAQPHVGDGGVFHSPSGAAFALALGVAYLLGLTYLHTFQKVAFVQHLAQLVPLATIVLLWALGWSVAGRVSSHRFYFVEHCAVAVLAGVVLSLLDQFTDYYAFAFNAESTGRILAWGGSLVVLTCLLYAHSRVCGAEGSRRLLMRTGGIALLIIGLGSLARYAERNDVTQVPSLLKPPAFRLARARSVDEFLDH